MLWTGKLDWSGKVGVSEVMALLAFLLSLINLWRARQQERTAAVQTAENRRLSEEAKREAAEAKRQQDLLLFEGKRQQARLKIVEAEMKVGVWIRECERQLRAAKTAPLRSEIMETQRSAIDHLDRFNDTKQALDLVLASSNAEVIIELEKIAGGATELWLKTLASDRIYKMKLEENHRRIAGGE
jgi:hypothetical protein